MSSVSREASRAASAAKSAARPWVERLARFGLAAKGIVYILIGGLAAIAAVDRGTPARGSRGAMLTLLEQPFGRFLLIAMGVGLLGFVLWRYVQAFLDVDDKGTDVKGLAVRGFYLASGTIYLSLAWAAVRMALGWGGGGGGEPSQGLTAKGLAQPHGQWLVGAAAAAVIGVGLYQFFRAYTAKFRKRLMLRQMSAREDRWATLSGRIGFAARGVTFTIIGYFVGAAALHANPEEAKGLEGALRALESNDLGLVVLATVALGLVAYGIFQLVMARYRRMVIE